jgi:outer membrane protein TolC
MSVPITTWARKVLALATVTGLVGLAAAAAPDGPDLPPYLPPNSQPSGQDILPVRAISEPPAATELPVPRKIPETAQPDQRSAEPVHPLTPIDLASALRLAGVENPEILIAEQRVVEAVAVHQLAAAQLLPSLNLGLNYDSHTGPLMSSSGNILKVDRSALYLGAGANAVAAGTVNVPGLVYNLNVSETIFACLISKQDIERAKFGAVAIRNEMFRRVAVAYAELLRAEGRRSIALQTRNEAAEVARVTAVFVKAGQAAQADGDRTANELTRRQTDLVEAEAEVLIASARLAELLALDQDVCMHPVEDKVVPTPIVPDPIPLEQLLAIAILKRPELAEWQAVVREALLALDGARLLPFSPNLIVGLSGGVFGGGGSVPPPVPPQPRFGNFGSRNDFDAIAYWTLQNLGCGNIALVKTAASRIRLADLEKLRVFNQVRREVADAYVRTHARFLQIATTEGTIRTGQDAFAEDFRRILGGQGRPIELLESLRQLAGARNAYLDAIVAYNEAQIDLYVAVGKPPADTLARPVPTNYAAPLPEARQRKQ